MAGSLAGKCAIVTGAADGLGRAAALMMAERGARLLLVDIDRSRLEGTERAIRDANGEAEAVIADVSDEAQVEAYVRQAEAAFGRVDAFFNNAGILGPRRSVTDCPTDDFDKVIAVNVRGVFLGLKHVLPLMVRQGSGAVVNTGSMGSAGGIPMQIPYVASKHAVIGMTRTAAGEVAAQGVRVNAVLPGNVRTKMALAGAREAVGGAGTGDRDEEAVAALSARLVPQGRMGRPEEIAAAVCFLLSDEAAHITGIELAVDGGILANAYGSVHALFTG